jgi:hypothetical protein
MNFQHTSVNHPCVHTVVCPTCGAPEGVSCHTIKSELERAEPHVKRVRAFRPVQPMPTQPEVAE